MTAVPSAVSPAKPSSMPFNAAEYLVDRHVKAGRGERLAVVASSGALTYRELSEEVKRSAAALRSIGVRPEERVMLCMADDIQLLAGILGAMYIGAVPVPTSTMFTGPELGKVLADSRARVLSVSAEFAEVAQVAVAAAPEVTDVLLDAEVPFKARRGVRVQQWLDLEGDSPARPYDTWQDSPALWLYTSGTTGLPKAAMHRHSSIRMVAEAYGKGVLDMGPDDRCLSVAKLFFAYGIGNSCFFPFAVGASAILERARPTPQLVAEHVKSEQPTLFFAVPTFYSALLHSDIPDDTFAGVRQGISAGEALPPVLYQRIRDRFGLEVLDGIGSTEALHIFLSNRPGAVRPGSSGVAVPGYDVELRDEQGSVITQAGKAGDLYLRGSSVATGYWCRAETTRQVFQGEWLRTGDTYMRNEDDTYSCLGRSNDMLKAGGIWVSPAEVEERLLEHPSVAEVAVVAAPDADGLDKPVACVVPVAGAAVDADELIAWCRDGLASFKRPREVVQVEELPKTATGKVRRNVLREHVYGTLTAEPAHAG
ncbi:benzoate-CoA ligase family protein [Kibdelosporangium philippinense]|uniref:Benzoate-CoA ligase family protein n=1 Tax=Kibdelosporangium philippinense TaxID=211113 RepID=A0ABS8Z650_9PSEU|nr:benzoate-CoA ligase family protein [Kibdelosporangium philippinense]MCE7002972.1 benzoate-CoA ligase family protein [Kibdelosporangium philippinense]